MRGLGIEENYDPSSIATLDDGSLALRVRLQDMSFPAGKVEMPDLARRFAEFAQSAAVMGVRMNFDSISCSARSVEALALPLDNRGSLGTVEMKLAAIAPAHNMRFYVGRLMDATL